VVRYWRLVALVTGWHVAASVCYYAVYAGTTLFRDAFSLSGVAVGFVITALTLGYATFLLPLGVATDRFGERRTLTVGLLGLSAGAVLVAAAPDYATLLVATFVLGSAYGTATPGTNKAIFDNVAPARQHRAIGIKQVGPTVGSAASALLITGLVGTFVWRAGFLVAAAVGLLAAGVFSVAYAGGGESTASYPNVRGLLANRSYALLVAAGVCIGAAFYTTTGYTVLYVEESVGVAVATAGAVLAVLQVCSSAGKILVGWLADALPGDQRRTVGTLLAAQTLTGGALFLALTRTGTFLGTAAAFAALGAFTLGSTGLYYSALSTLVDEDDIGAASAGGQLAATVGGLLAPPLFGYLVDAVGYDAGWGFLGALSVLAAGLVAAAVVAAP